MKKTLIYLVMLAMLLVPYASLAQENSPSTLAIQETSEWCQKLLERAINEHTPADETIDGLAVIGKGYTLFPLEKTLSKDMFLNGAVVDLEATNIEGLEGPRNTRIGDSVEAVLAAFANDNPSLQGTPDQAVLYIRGSYPETLETGIVIRNGQSVNVAEYCVYSPQGAGYTVHGLQYTFESSKVSAIRFFTQSDITGADVENFLSNLSAVQEESSYSSYQTIDPEMMLREDLTFAGLDYPDLTPETAKELLGEPVSSETITDSNGNKIITNQWENVTIAFAYDQNGNYVRPDHMTVNGGMDEGPRGIRIGEELSDIMARFKNDSGMTKGDKVYLYGNADTQQPPYGMLIQNGDTYNLMYAVQLEDHAILFSGYFINNQLVEYSMKHL